MLRQWTSSSSSQLSLIIFSVVVWVAGTSSVQHDVNNDDSTASSSTTLPPHDSPASADDPVQSSPLQSLIVLLGPSESPETIQNPLNPSEELLDPLESKVSTENPLRTAINASVDSSASLQVIQDPFPSSEVAEDPSEATDVLRDLRGTKRGSRNPSGSLGGPENPRETPETPLDVPLTQAAPTSAEQPDDDPPPPPPGSSHFIREVRQTTRSLSDVLRSSEGVQDDQGFPHPTKESPEGPDVSLGTPSLKDDRLETQPDSPEPSHARRDEAKLSLWEIISSSSLADDVTTSSKSHPDDVELAESISEAFNSSEDMREEFKPVDSIQDVLKALESIKHNLRSAESIQDALSIPGAIQKRLRSSSGTSPAALTKSASIRISHNQPPRGSIMLQDAERHAIIDADLLRALSLEVKDELRARTAESDGPVLRRFTGIGRPRALLPPGQKRRRRISRRYNRTRPLASSNPHVYAREGGSMTFDARRRYRKKPDDNSEDKVALRDHEATQEVVEPVTLLDPTTSARAGYKPDLTMRKYTTDVEDMREAVGLNSYEIRKEERGEESTDPQAGGGSVGDLETRSKTRDYVPRTTSRPGDHNRDESQIHLPENQENTAVYDVEAEHNSRYTLPSRQEAHLPGHPTPPGGHRAHEVTSGGRGLRRDESQASSDHPQAIHTITQPPGSHPRTVPEAPSFYISPTPPVVRSIPRPSPSVILNHPPRQLLTKRPPQTSPTHYDRSPDPVPDPGNTYATKPAATQDTDLLGYSTRKPSFLNSVTQEHPRTPWPSRQASPTRASTPTAGRTTSPSTSVQGMAPISYDPEAVIREIIGFHGHGHRFLPSYPPVIRSFSPQRFTPPLPVTPPPPRPSPYTRVVWRVTPSAAPSPHRHPNPPPRHTHTAHLHPGSQSSSDLSPGSRLPPSSHTLSPDPPPPPPPLPPTPPHQPSLGSGGPRHPPHPTNQAGPDHTRAKASPPAVVVAPPMAVGPRSSQPPRPSPRLPIPRYTDTRPTRGHTTTKRAHAAPKLPHASVEPTYTPSGTESLPSNPTYSPPELIFMPSEPLPTTPRPVYLTSHPEFEPRTVYKTREHSDRRQMPVNTNASPTKVTRRIPAKPVQEYPTYGAVPPTSFTCDDKLTGYYADPEAYCQVFHMCHYEGQQHSFLCPNGTLFNQQLLTCDHWRNVNCHKATSHYVVNKKLYRLQKKDQYSNKSKRQTSQIPQDQANTVTPSSYWRPEMMSFPYRPIIDSYVTIPSPHSASSRVNSPYRAPITDSYVTTPSLHTVSSLANTPYGAPTKVSYVTAPQSYKAVVALG
ncbi:uncharacterized protein [Panulirus ornatus]|uniref:uncharacterized protein n=1 Tax=Panulirus ornatus TaxID=150431 RepID=UPI003A8AAE23